MKIAVDISLYPLTGNYIPPIDDVIARINRWPNVEVSTNRLSTQVVGEYAEVMQLLTKELATSFAEDHQSVFVTKFLRADSLGE